MSNILRYDVLILGSGAAGLSLALKLRPDIAVAVVSKGALHEGNTYYAQGGISAVLDPNDSVDAHSRGTLRVGGTLCDPEVVRLVVEHGPREIRWLLQQGVSFTRDSQGKEASGYYLTREGGHSHRRVIHTADATGREIAGTLDRRIRERANVRLYEVRDGSSPWSPAAWSWRPMASNSLLECLVYSELAARDIEAHMTRPAPEREVPPGTRAGSRSPMKRSWSPTTGTSCTVSWGISGYRPHQQAPATGQTPGRPAALGDHRILQQLPRQ